MMKKIFLAVMAAVLSLSTAAADAPKGIDFFDGTLAEALAKAGTEGKQVFIYFHIPSCRPCVFFKKNIIPDAKAGEYFNTRFVNLSLDAEIDPGFDIAKEFDVQFFPTFMVFDPDRKLVTQYNSVGTEALSDTKLFIEKLEKNMAAGLVDNEAVRMMREMQEWRKKAEGLPEDSVMYTDENGKTVIKNSDGTTIILNDTEEEKR